MPTEPTRGDIWLVNLGNATGHEQSGERPCIIIRQDAFYITHPGTTIVIPCTKKGESFTPGTTVKLPAGEGGLSFDSVVLCHQLRVVDCQKFLRQIGTLRSEKLSEIELTLGHVLGLP